MTTRRIYTAEQFASSTWALQDEKQKMLDLSMLAQSILGVDTLVSGFDCTPTSPLSLEVIVGQGVIFKYVQVDATPFGTNPQIAADTTNSVLKYAYNVGNYSPPAFVPPATPGDSRNDLIQINFLEDDGSNENIPFWGGITYVTIGGNQIPIPNPASTASVDTQRIDSVVISVKAGTPAPTGTQTTPTPDAGNIGMWVITTTNGDSTISGGDINPYTSDEDKVISETLMDKISQATADLRYAQITAIQAGSYTYSLTAGGTTAYTASLTPPLAGYSDGQVIDVYINAVNTDVPTINIDGNGAKEIVFDIAGTPLFKGMLQVGYNKIQYNSSLGKFVLLTPPTSIFAEIEFNQAVTGGSPGTAVKATDVIGTLDVFGLWDNTNKRFIPKLPGFWEVTLALIAQPAGTAYTAIALEYFNGAPDRIFLTQFTSNADDYADGNNFIIDFDGSTDYTELWLRADGQDITYNCLLRIKYLGNPQ